MRSDKFNTLLKYSEVEHESSDDLVLSSDQDDEFYFRFHYSSGNVYEWPEHVQLTDLQKERVRDHIHNWCEARRAEKTPEPYDWREQIY